MAVQVFKDPYLFDFLGTDAPRRETELEQGLVALPGFIAHAKLLEKSLRDRFNNVA